jgi:hypothetical protein
MTTMPKRRPKTPALPRKIGVLPAGGGRIVPDAVMDDFIKRMSTFNDEMRKLGVTKK